VNETASFPIPVVGAGLPGLMLAGGRSDAPACEGATLPPVDRRHHPTQAGRHKRSDRQSQAQSAEMQFG
jgi:hypothetical protein